MHINHQLHWSKVSTVLTKWVARSLSEILLLYAQCCDKFGSVVSTQLRNLSNFRPPYIDSASTGENHLSYNSSRRESRGSKPSTVTTVPPADGPDSGDILSTLAFYKKIQHSWVVRELMSWSCEFKTAYGLYMYLLKNSTACASSQRPMLKELSQGQKWLHMFSDSKAYDEQIGSIPWSNGNLDIGLFIAHNWSPHWQIFHMLMTQNLPRDRKLTQSCWCSDCCIFSERCLLSLPASVSLIIAQW